MYETDGLWRQTAYIHILAGPLPGSVTPKRLLSLSVPLCAYLQKRGHNSTYLGED